MNLKRIGIGVDIVEISRFKKTPYSTKPNFYKKIFISSEIKHCLKYKNPYQHFAGKFALKEAIQKSINEKISMLEIETLYSNSKPTVQLKRKMKNKYRFLLSLSHEQNIVIAVAISEKIA